MRKQIALKAAISRIVTFVIVAALFASCLFMIQASAGTVSSCSMGGTELNKNTINDFMNDVENYDFSSPNSIGMLTYHLTSSVSWSGTLVIPDGLFIGICMHTYDYYAVKGDWVAEGRGGIYVYRCGYDYISDLDSEGNYSSGKYHTYLYQEQCDFYTDYCDAYGLNVFDVVGTDEICVALRTSVVVDSVSLIIPEGCTFKVERNGYTFTDAIGMESAGGNLLITAYHSSNNLVHTNCGTLNYKTTNKLTTEKLLSLDKERHNFYCLGSDFSWDGILEIPEGLYIGICLNGFELDGEWTLIDTDEEGTPGYGEISGGGIYTFECCDDSYHEDDGYTSNPINQGMVDYFEAVYAAYGISVYDVYYSSNLHIYLKGDVNFTNGAFAPPMNCELSVCYNERELGYTCSFSSAYEACEGSINHYRDCHICAYNLVEVSVAANSENIGELLDALDYVSADEIPFVTMYLTSDITLPRVMNIPKNMVIMLCLNGYEFEGEYKTSGKGALLIGDCGTHTHADIPEPMVVVNQGYIDFIEAVSAYLKRMQGVTLLDALDNDIYISLDDDVVFDNEMWHLPIGMNLVVCENGHKITDNINLEANGGRVIRTDCNGELSHTCPVVGESIDYVNNDNLASVIEYISSMDPTATPYINAYLTEDIKWSEPISVPAGVYALVCLNGHKATGPVDNGGDNGYIFFLECSDHQCATGEQSLSLNARSYSWLAQMLSSKSFETETNIYVTLDHNMSIEGTICAPDNVNIYICTNGKTFNANVDNTLTSGKIYIYNCKNKVSCTLPEGTFAVESQPIHISTASIINKKLATLSDGDIALYYLTCDVLDAGELVAPAGVTVGICLNGFDIGGLTVAEGSDIFFYECGAQYCEQLLCTIPSFDQRALEFISHVSWGEELIVDGNCIFAISGDVDFPSGLLNISELDSVHVCTGGHNFTGLPKAEIHSTCIPGNSSSNICTVCLRNEDKACALDSNSIYDIIDRDGVLTLDPGTYYYYLSDDLHLPYTLTIPAGVDFNLCLNGYALYSPYIYLVQNDPARPYCFNTITVEYGATLSVYDCSPEQTGAISINFKYYRDENGNINIDAGEGLGLSGLGVIVSTPIVNCGTFNMYGGLLTGMTGMINVGEAYLSNTQVIGFLFATAQGIIDSLGGACDNPSMEICNGSVVVGAMYGVASAYGETCINQATVIAGTVAIADSLELGNSPDDMASTLVLKEGTAIVGDINLIYDTIANMDAGVLSELIQQAADPDDSDYDQYVGVICNGNLIIRDDFNVVMGPNAEAKLEKNSYATVADFLLSENTNVIIECELSKFYTVASDGKTTVTDGNNNFLPAGGYMAQLNEDGEIVIYPIPGDYVAPMKVLGVSASTAGDVRFNIYVQLNSTDMTDEEREAFLRDVLLAVNYKGKTCYYSINDAVCVDANNDIYVFTLGTSPKDYREEIQFFFINPDGSIPKVYDTDVEYYLNVIVKNSAGSYSPEAVDLAGALLNYCQAASYHFGTANTYAPGSDVIEIMDSITVDDLVDYAPVRSDAAAESKVSFLGATVVLKDITSIKLYFDMATYVDENGETHKYSLDEVSITYIDPNGNLVVVTPVETGIKSRPYVIEIDGIYAKDMSFMYTISVDGVENISYGVFSYVYTVLAAPSRYSKDVIDVVKSMVIYCIAADEFARSVVEEN